MVKLTPGTRLRAGSSSARCRLALIVVDRSGRRFGLSAGHILALAENDFVFDQKTGIPIGQPVQLERTTRELPSLEEPPFFETIGAFEIFEREDAQVIVADHSTLGSAASPTLLVGRKVRKLDGAKVASLGTVIGFGGGLLFTNPYGGEQKAFSEPLIVSFGPKRTSSVADGDAGCLLLDEDNDLVGILISKGNDRFYAAPLKPFLECYGLSVWDHPSESEEPKLAPLTDLDAQKAKIKRVRVAVQQMNKTFALERNVHKDPQGKKVPKRLLRLMGNAA